MYRVYPFSPEHEALLVRLLNEDVSRPSNTLDVNQWPVTLYNLSASITSLDVWFSKGTLSPLEGPPYPRNPIPDSGRIDHGGKTPRCACF